MSFAIHADANYIQIVTGLPKVGKGEIESDPGCYKCEKNCHTCKILKEGKHFWSTNTGRRYNLQQKVSCESSFVVYLGTCLQCKGKYIGKSTQQFRRRHSGHKQEIKNVIGGLGHHYGGARGCGYTNISMQIIEKVNQGDHTQLAKREVYWQNEMRCFVQNGGGGHCYRKEK